MSAAISIEHVTKIYRLGAIGGTTLQEDFARWWARLRGRIESLGMVEYDQHTRRHGQLFTALHDVSFNVRQGDIVGLVGRNGAGKSTLLKILSQVTTPTLGQVRIRGRVASLLEVGTGFHPELTGRENIFLNGAILGMTKAEIRRKFDEIVAFSECETFIDTPVKRYSSGMYVRLAFAVAAHLEPEILIVDEVLAVGDAQFQKKCLGKMQDVGREGRTVLFVSHNMAAVTRLCTHAVLLDEGRFIKEGPVGSVLGTYLDAGLGIRTARTWSNMEEAPGDDVVRIIAIRVTQDQSATDAVDIRRAVNLEVEYEVLKGGSVLIPNIHVYNGEGVCAFIAHDCDPAWRRQPKPPGRYRSVCQIPGNFLAEGSYMIGVAISTHVPLAVHAWAPDAVGFEVIDSIEGDSARGDYAGPYAGVVRPLLPWRTTTEFPVEGVAVGGAARI